jgi:hypothetical protein
MFKEKEYDEAEAAFNRVLAAVPREGRPIAPLADVF